MTSRTLKILREKTWSRMETLKSRLTGRLRRTKIGLTFSIILINKGQLHHLEGPDTSSKAVKTSRNSVKSIRETNTQLWSLTLQANLIVNKPWRGRRQSREMRPSRKRPIITWQSLPIIWLRSLEVTRISWIWAKLHSNSLESVGDLTTMDSKSQWRGSKSQELMVIFTWEKFWLTWDLEIRSKTCLTSSSNNIDSIYSNKWT